MDHQNGRAILHGARVFTIAGKFLEKIRSLSIAARFKAEKKHARLLLAHRSRERHPFTAKHRAECTLVFYRAPRTRPRLLFQGLLASASSLFTSPRRGA